MADFETTLASGLGVRVSPRLIQVLRQNGKVIQGIDVSRVTGFSQSGQTVSLEIGGSPGVRFDFTSPDDADQMLAIIQGAQPAPTTTSLRPGETIVKEYKGLRPTKSYQKDVQTMTRAGWEVINVASLSIPFPGRIVVTYRRG